MSCGCRCRQKVERVKKRRDGGLRMSSVTVSGGRRRTTAEFTAALGPTATGPVAEQRRRRRARSNDANMFTAGKQFV